MSQPPRRSARPRVESLESRIVMGYYSADATDETPLPLFPTTCPPMPGGGRGGNSPGGRGGNPPASGGLGAGGDLGEGGGWSGIVGSAYTTKPIRAFDGLPLISAIDLDTASPVGITWGLTRTWSGLNNSGPIGNGWNIGEMPYLVVGGGSNGSNIPNGGGLGLGFFGVLEGTALDDRISVVQGGTSASTFAVVSDGQGTFNYVPWDSSRLKLERIAAVEPILRLTDAQGNVTEFFDVKRDANNKPVNATMAVNPTTRYGRFKSYRSSAGSRVEAAYGPDGNLISQCLTGPSNNVLERIVYGYATVTNDLVAAASTAPASLVSVATLQRPDGQGSYYDVQRSLYSYYTGRITGGAQGNLIDDPNGRMGDLKTVETQNARTLGSVVDWQTTDATYFRYYKFTGETHDSNSSRGPTNDPATTGGPLPLDYRSKVDKHVFSGLKTVVTGQSLAQLAASLPGFQSATDDAIRPFVNHFFRYTRWADHEGADGRSDVSNNGNINHDWRIGYRTGSRYRVVEELAQGEGCSCSTGQGTYKYDYTANYLPLSMGYNSIEQNTWRMKLTEYLPSNSPGWGTHDRHVAYLNEVGLSLLDVFVDVGEDARPINSASATYHYEIMVTVNATGHGFATGDRVAMSGMLPALYNGVFTVTRIDADNFKFQLPKTYQGEYVYSSVPNPSTTPGNSTATRVLGEWATYHRYDAAGRLILDAAPSAVSGYDENWAELVDNGTGTYPGLWPSSGLIQTYSYYTDTTAGATTQGGVAGYFRASFVQQGRTGTPIVTESTTYYTHADAAGIETFVIAADTVYGIDSGTALDFSDRAPRTTSYAYAWYAGTNQIAATITARPVVGVGQNGPGTADLETTVYDLYGRITWTRDGDGFIRYQEYDPASGSLVRIIDDVNTALPGTPASLPPGWATPLGGGNNLVTAMAVDAQGRMTKMVDANGHVTYWVYNDAAHEVRIYHGWDALTGTTTGPIEVVREDWARNYRETFAMATAPAVAGSPGSYVPTGAEAIAGVVSLMRNLLDLSHRVAETDVYVSFVGIAYSAAALRLGAPGTNYDATMVGYDDRGRHVRTFNAVGTIAIVVYDGLGRLTSAYMGTDDSTPNGYRWTPSTGGPNSNMTRIASYTYDGGGVGDGNLTETTQYPDGNPANARTTRFTYDWRDRRVATKVGVQTVEDAATNRPIVFADYNNLGEVLSTAMYDGDGVALSTTRPAASLLRAVQTTDYDDQGRVYRQRTFSVDQATGAISPYALTTSTYYNHRGQTTAVYHPGGLVTKTLYDGAGRLALVSTTDQFGGTSWNSATTLGSEHVLEQVVRTYDGVGNVIQTSTVQRAHDAPADLLGSLVTTTLTNSTAPPLLDRGFEAATQVGPGQFLYAPTNSPWRYVGTAGLVSDAGVSGNGSAFTQGIPNAPEGQRVAFVQKDGQFSQSIAGWAAGVYRISFQAAQRGNFQSSSQDFQVLVDDKVVGTFRPAGTSYQAYSTPSFTVPAGSHAITFRGLNSNGGDNTALLDAIGIAPGSPTAQSGDGLKATYYSTEEFTGTSVSRVDPTVNFDWAYGSPDSGIPADRFSAVWTGHVLAPVDGTYTFSTISDDGVRLWVNDQLLVDNWTTHPPTENSGTITLAAGQFYSIRMEYFESHGGAMAQLLWSRPGAAKEVIPQAYLFSQPVVAARNARTSYAVAYYDAADRPTATVDFGTNGGSTFVRPVQVPTRSDQALVTSYAYDPAGRMALVTDPRGVRSATEYDMKGQVRRTVAGFTPSAAWTPGDPTAPMAAPTNATNSTTAYTYDGLGQVTTVTAVMPAGTPSQTTTYVYGVSPATGSAIASNDLLAAIVQPDEATGLMPTGAALATHRVALTYNALGEATGRTDAVGTTHQYTRDILGRLVADAVTTLGAGVDGAVRRLETAYDAQGHAYHFSSYDAASGGTLVNQVLDTYNGLGQITARYQEHAGAVNTASTPAVRYTYREMAGGANDSRLLGMTYPNGRTLHHVYGAGLDDAIGRVSALADDASGTPDPILEGYTYLGLGSVVGRTHPQTGVDLTLIRQPGDFRANPDGGDQYTGLDRFGRVIDVHWARTGGTAARYQYGHDRAGNALYRADLVDAALSELYHPDSQTAGDDNTAYDALGRLRGYRRGVLSASGNNTGYDSSANAIADRTWSLDALGNWVGTSGSAGSTTRTFNAANQETSSSAGAAPTFDNNGNTLTAQGKSYTYDAWNRLVAVRDTASNTLLASYGFDALRRRITETHGAATTHVYFTPSWQVVEERVGGTGASATATQYVLSLTGSIVLRDQVAGGSVVASARLYALTDANGNVVALVDPSGVAVERYAYDPYGTVQVLDGSGGPRAGNSSQYGWQYRFQGGRVDTATSLYLFGHRDYDPAQGRWIERDPIGLSAGDANIYRFVGDNPVNRSDPTGLQYPIRGGSSPWAGIRPHPLNQPIPGVMGPSDAQLFPGGQKPYSFPNFTGSPANTLVFIGPPTDSPAQPPASETYNIKGPYLAHLGIPLENIYYYNGSASLEDAIKNACGKGIKNPKIYFWGHAAPGTLLIGNPNYVGFQGKPGAGRWNYELADASRWQWFVNLVRQLNTSQTNICACNFVGKPGSPSRPGDALVSALATGTNAPASGLIGLEGPWNYEGEWTWNLQTGGSLTTYRPKQ